MFSVGVSAGKKAERARAHLLRRSRRSLALACHGARRGGEVRVGGDGKREPVYSHGHDSLILTSMEAMRASV